jgi:hypothetical protein
MRHETQRWNLIKAVVEIVTAGAGLTGKSPTAFIRRTSDGTYLQGGFTWDVAAVAHSLTAVDAANLPGLYSFVVPIGSLDVDAGADGYVIKIEEATVNLIEYVAVEQEFSVHEDINTDVVIGKRSSAGMLNALFKFLISSEDDIQTGYQADAGSTGGKFYISNSPPAIGRAAQYIGRVAVHHDQDSGNGEHYNIARIGALASDGGGTYFTLTEIDGTAYLGDALPGHPLWVGNSYIRSYVDQMHTDSITASALATSAVNEIVDQVWEEILPGFHTGAGKAGQYLINTAFLPTKFEISDQVWREVLGDHSGTPNSTAEALAALTPELIADQVWEEQIGDHSGTGGSTAEALEAAGGGITVGQIADAVWDEGLGGHHGGGSAGRALAITKGLVQGHHRLRNPSYDPNGRLLTAELVVYPTALDATDDQNEDFVFNVTCTYDGDGNLTSLLSTE